MLLALQSLALLTSVASPTPATAQVSAPLTGVAWADLNENGVRDSGETGVGGILVALLDCRGTFLEAQLTGHNGAYTFPSVPRGDYRLQFILNTGYILTVRQAGTDPSVDSDADVTGMTDCFTFAADGTQMHLDVGLVFSGSIHGVTWYERDRDGIRERGEPMLQGMQILLLTCNGEQIASTVTGMGGVFRFSGLPIGAYRIGVPGMEGLTATRVNVRSDGTDNDVDPQTRSSDCVALAPGQTEVTLDVGVRDSLIATTFEQDAWGAPPEASHLGSLLVSNFSKVFPRGMTVGLSSTNRLKFTSAQAIIDFLPASGPVGVLHAPQLNPLTTEAGEFAGNLTALKLNVSFALTRKLPRLLASLRIEPGHKFSRYHVMTILAMAEKMIAGARVRLPEGATIDDLNDAMKHINQNCDCGIQDFGYLGR